ncbi:hypothetical protein AAIR98_000712 [Elusimicrobium simillimum]|uniref:PPC domain-containing DNA-binding protein n=1 Tax=Elusimicrobium simillimum TaxID=3143438 RepID=UPI003C7029E7
MAEEKPYLTGRTYIFRLPKGKDLLDSITSFCHDNQIKCGVINGVGAVENATLSHYDQAKKKYDKVTVSEPCEIISLVGNVSIKDNRPFINANMLLSDKAGNLKGGRLTIGTKIFTAEMFIQELVGEPKVRKEDKVTKLQLWV